MKSKCKQVRKHIRLFAYLWANVKTRIRWKIKSRSLAEQMPSIQVRPVLRSAIHHISKDSTSAGYTTSWLTFSASSCCRHTQPQPIQLYVCVYMWVRLFYALRTANGFRALFLQSLSLARKQCVAATAHVSSCCVFIAVAMNNQYVGQALPVSWVVPCVASCCCRLHSPTLLTIRTRLFLPLASVFMLRQIKNT